MITELLSNTFVGDGIQADSKGEGGQGAIPPAIFFLLHEREGPSIDVL